MRLGKNWLIRERKIRIGVRWFARNQRVIGRRNSEILSLVDCRSVGSLRCSYFFFLPFSFCLPPFPFLADSRFSRFETQSLPSLLRCYPRSFTFYLGNSLSSILLRLGRGFFPRARPLLSGAPFAHNRFGFWLFRRGRLPLFLVQIPSKLLISKTAAEAGSSNCKCSCDLNRPAARCHVPRTFV
jgi:hypothetical protein